MNEHHYSQLKDVHAGETGLIVANGPSLLDVPIPFLKKYPSFGMNRVNFEGLFPEFCPSFYVCIGGDQLNTPERRERVYPIMEHPDLKAAFINRLMVQHFRGPKVYSIMGGKLYGLEPHKAIGFSKDPLDIMGIHATMTYGCLQLAYYMGFETVLIVGLDGTYNGKMHAYPESEFPLFKSGPGVHGDDETWRARCEGVYTLSRQVYEEDGRRIVNLTEGSMIESLERGEIGEWE